MNRTSKVGGLVILAGVAAELLSPHQARAGSSWEPMSSKLYSDMDENCLLNGKLELDQGLLGFIAPRYIMDVKQISVEDIKAENKWHCWRDVGGDIGTIAKIQTPGSIIVESTIGPLASFLTGGTVSLLNVGTTVGVTAFDAINRDQNVLIAWENKNCSAIRSNTPGTRQIGNQWVHIIDYDGKKWKVCSSTDGERFGGMAPVEDTVQAVAPPVTPAALTSVSAPTLASAPAVPAPVAQVAAPVRPGPSVPAGTSAGTSNVESLAAFCASHPTFPRCVAH